MKSIIQKDKLLKALISSMDKKINLDMKQEIFKDLERYIKSVYEKIEVTIDRETLKRHNSRKE
jgi:hypothetical protein